MAMAQAGIQITADISAYAKAMRQMENATSSAFSKVTSAASLLGVSLSAAGAIAFTKQVIDMADSLNDLEKRTGISVERLSAWRLATEQSGTSMEALSGALGKAGKYMVEHGDNLKAIGITGKTAEETMIQLAGVISSLPADDPRRVALAMEVLGKSAGDLLPLLSEGESGLRKVLSEGEKFAAITPEMARSSAEFNDRLSAMKAQMFVGSAIIVNNMLPALTKLLDLIDRLSGNESPQKASSRLFDELASAQEDLSKKMDQKQNGFFGLFITDDDIARQQRYVNSIKAQLKVAITETDAERAKAVKAEENRNKRADDVKSRLGDINKILSNKTTEKEKISDYQRLTQEVLKFTSAQQNEASGAEKLTQGQTMALDIMTKIQAGTLKLSDSEKIRLGGMLETALTIEKLNDTEAEADKRRHAAAEKHIADFKAQQEALAAYENDWNQHLGSLEQNLKTLEEQNQLYGLTAEQIAAVNVQRAQETVDIARTNGVSDDYIARLERELELRKGILTKTGALEQKQAWTSIFGSIESTAHDTFISIFDSGKSAFDRLKHTLKNGLLDLLYQMTIKKWIFNIGASVTGVAASVSALAAGESGGLPGLMSGGNSILDVFTKGLGTLIGGPVGGILGSVAVSLLGGLFGGGTPHPAASASAQLDNGKFSIVNANAKHLSKDSLNPFLLSSLTAYSDFVKSLGGKETKPLYLASSYDQNAKNMRIGAVNTFSANSDDATAVSNAVKAVILDGIKSGTTDLPKYLKAMLDAATITTENASALMQAMAGFKQLRDSLAGMPVVFAKIATAIDSGFIPSMESAQALIQSTSTYYDAYYAEAERLALAQQGIASQFAALNVTLPTSKEGFRALVEGIDTSTAAGIGLYSALMQIAPGFAQVQDAATAAAQAAAQAQADLMQQRKGWQEQLDVLTGARTQTQIDRTNQLASTTDDATKALMQQVFAQQDAASAAAAAQQAAQAQIDAAQRITDAWQGIADSVLGEVTRLRDKIMGSSPNSLAGAQSAFAIATAQARAGDQTAANSLPALSSKLDDLYAVTSASSADYRLALARQAASLLTTVDSMKQYGINVPGFASGGDFSGGWRVVGERGRELEATGPARIFNASQTANILGGSADIGQLRNDIQAMTAKLEIMVGKMREIEKNTFDTAKATNGRADAPVLVKVTT